MSKDLIAYCGLYYRACSFKVAFESNNSEHVMRMPSQYDRLKNTPLEFYPGYRLDNNRVIKSNLWLRRCVTITLRCSM